MKLYLISILFFIQNLFGQSVVKQITDFDFNSENPVSLSSDIFYLVPNEDLVFEGRKDSSVNIYLLKYDVAADSFYQLKQITACSIRYFIILFLMQ